MHNPSYSLPIPSAPDFNQSQPSSSRSSPSPQPSVTFDWNNRHFSLNPKWYQVEKVARQAGYILLGCGILTGLATGYAALFFTATPQTVIATVSGLAVFSLATTISGIVFMMKKTFWQDPVFRVKHAQEICQEAEKNDWSYQEIQQKHGQRIQAYALFNQIDINLLLRKEARDLDYPTFHERYFYKDKKLFETLDDTNLAALHESFKQFLSSPDGLLLSYAQFEAKYRKDLPFLDKENILLDLMYDRLFIDIQCLSYSKFISKHYPEGISSTFNLPANHITELNNKFSLETAQLPYQQIWGKYEIDCHALGISQVELESTSFKKDIINVLRDALDYNTFRSRNNFKNLQYLITAEFDPILELGQKLLNHVASREEGLLWIKDHFKEDLIALDGLEKHLTKAIEQAVLVHQLALLKQNELPYLQFKANNGLEFIEEVNRKVPGFKNDLKEIFIQQVPQWNKGVEHLKEECHLFNCFNELKAAIVPRELKSLETIKITYKEFRERNGLAVIKELTTDHLLFKKCFLKMSYEKMIEESHIEDLIILSISYQDIEQALIQDAQNMPCYLGAKGFREKHCPSLFEQQNQFSPSTWSQLKGDLRIKLVRELTGQPYSTIQHYKNDYKILEVRVDLLIQEDFKKSYVQFKNKHGLGPFKDLVISEPQHEIFISALQTELKSMPYSQIAGYSEDLSFFNLSLNKILEERWQSKSISEIFSFSDEKQAFCWAFETGQLNAIQWHEKALQETKNLSVLQLIKNYADLLKLNILIANLEIKGFVDCLIVRLEKEIQSISTFEHLIQTYGESIFNYGLVESTNYTIATLVTNYYKKHPSLSYTPSSTLDSQLIEKFNLKPPKLVNALNAAKLNFESLKRNYSLICHRIQQQDERAKINEEELAKREISQYQSSLNLIFIPERLKKEQESLKQEIQKIETASRTFNSEKSNLSKCLQQAEDVLKQNQSEKQRLGLLVKNYSAKKVRLEELIKGLKAPIQTTGLVEAFAKPNQIKQELEKVTNDLNYLELAPSDLNCCIQKIEQQETEIKNLNLSLAQLQNPLHDSNIKQRYDQLRQQQNINDAELKQAQQEVNNRRRALEEQIRNRVSQKEINMKQIEERKTIELKNAELSYLENIKVLERNFSAHL
jgi:hypothetical protein